MQLWNLVSFRLAFIGRMSTTSCSKLSQQLEVICSHARNKHRYSRVSIDEIRVLIVNSRMNKIILTTIFFPYTFQKQKPLYNLDTGFMPLKFAIESLPKFLSFQWQDQTCFWKGVLMLLFRFLKWLSDCRLDILRHKFSKTGPELLTRPSNPCIHSEPWHIFHWGDSCKCSSQESEGTCLELPARSLHWARDQKRIAQSRLEPFREWPTNLINLFTYKIKWFWMARWPILHILL